MTDQELEEIRATVVRKGDGETGCLRCGADEWRINGYCSCECECLAEREADITALLAEVERLKGLITYAQDHAIEAMSDIHHGRPTVAGGRMVAINTACDKALNPEGWNDAK